jgi:hypothetical protein
MPECLVLYQTDGTDKRMVAHAWPRGGFSVKKLQGVVPIQSIAKTVCLAGH